MSQRNKNPLLIYEIFLYYTTLILSEQLISSILFPDRVSIILSTFINMRMFTTLLIYVSLYFFIFFIFELELFTDLSKDRNVLNTLIHLLNTYVVTFRTLNFESMLWYKNLNFFYVLLIIFLIIFYDPLTLCIDFLNYMLNSFTVLLNTIYN